jgi:hypothetical protein
MEAQRILEEIARASRHFALVEAHRTSDGGIVVKAGLQTTLGGFYVATVTLVDYPSQMPAVFLPAPILAPDCPHRYANGHICYLHPSKWNPGFHDLTFVLGRTAKWLNKYEVWRRTRKWPGAQAPH